MLNPTYNYNKTKKHPRTSIIYPLLFLLVLLHSASSSLPMAQKSHVAIMPTPGMGHFIPLVGIAKKLVLNHDLSVTFIVPSIGPPPDAQKQVLESLPEGINYILLPPVSFEDLPAIKAETQICLTVIRSLSSIRGVLKSLIESTRLVALVVDLFGTDVFEIAMEFNVPTYIAHLSTSMVLSLLLYMQKLDEMVSCEYGDMPEPVLLPGCRIPVRGRDLPDPTKDRTDDAYKWFLHHAKRHCLSQGILLNSFMDLEADTIKALQENESSQFPPIYPIGPIIQSVSSSGVNEFECLKWLDDQPSGSVLFVSFGSGGSLSYEQLSELAMGLETSEQKFLWVVRSPDNISANASYFSAKSNTDPSVFLPKGFLDRTKGQGLVVPSWAPQIQVLSHGSTGGFLTHCGWNSTLESIVYGVPLIAWPLYAEQKMNAGLLSEELKVALRPKANENGIVRREEIAKIVKDLMKGEGVAIHERMNRLKEAAAKAGSEEGSSTKSLSEVVLKWKNKTNA